MLILIEGVDGSGKTTLAKQLSDKYKLLDTPDRKDPDIYHKYMKLCEDKQVYLNDRSFITDMVYRMYDYLPYIHLNLTQIDRILAHCKIIYCQNANSFKNSMERGEDNITDPEKSETLKRAYVLTTLLLHKYADCPMLVYDWEHNTVEDVVNFIEGGK